MDSDTNAQDNTNVTPVDEVPTAPVVDDQPSEEVTEDTLAPAEPVETPEEPVDMPQAGDVIEPTPEIVGDGFNQEATEEVDTEDEKPETVPHEACRGTGLEQGLPDATKLCDGCEGSGVVKAEV